MTEHGNTALPHDIARETLPAGDGWGAAGPGTRGGADAAPQDVHLVRNRADLVAALTPHGRPRIVKVLGRIDLSTGDDGRPLGADDHRHPAFSWPAYAAAYDPATWGRRPPEGPLEDARLASARAQAARVVIPVPSRTTLIGWGPDATLVNGGLALVQVQDVIIRNLHIRDAYDHFPAWDPKDNGHGEWNAAYDNITLRQAERVWVDHCTLDDGDRPDAAEPSLLGRRMQRHDGLLDITRASSHVTVSWTHFRHHDKTSLVGGSDGHTDDDGRLKVTYHHNLWEQTRERSPRVRYGQVHAYNNLYPGAAGRALRLFHRPRPPRVRAQPPQCLAGAHRPASRPAGAVLRGRGLRGPRLQRQRHAGRLGSSTVGQPACRDAADHRRLAAVAEAAHGPNRSGGRPRARRRRCRPALDHTLTAQPRATAASSLNLDMPMTNHLATHLRFGRILLTGAAGNLGCQLRPRPESATATSCACPTGPTWALPLRVKNWCRRIWPTRLPCMRCWTVWTWWCTWAACPPNRPGAPSSTPTSPAWCTCTKQRVRTASSASWFASSNHVTGFYRQDEVVSPKDPIRPDGLYGLSKAFGEGLAQLYWDRFGIETVSLRIGSSFPAPRDRRMLATWLSYDDAERLVVAALSAPVVGHTIIYGVSDNPLTWWDNTGARHVGFQPQDSSEVFRAEIEQRQGAIDPSDPAARHQGGAFVRTGPFFD